MRSQGERSIGGVHDGDNDLEAAAGYLCGGVINGGAVLDTGFQETDGVIVSDLSTRNKNGKNGFDQHQSSSPSATTQWTATLPASRIFLPRAPS